MGALAGLQVVEVGGGIAIAYATKLLGDLGAEVITIEPPTGDPLRTEDADLFGYLHEGKRSVVATQPFSLTAAADVVVTSVDVDGARVVVQVTPFGRTGPYRDLAVSDLTLQAMGGWVSSHGIPGLQPVQVGGRAHDYVAGAFAACAALTAHRAAAELAQPISVDLSVMECLVGTLAYPMLFLQTLTALGMPAPEARYSVLPGIVRCRNGWVGINALTGQHWQDICALLDAPEFAGRQRELGTGGRDLDRFYGRVQPWLDLRDVEEVVEQCQLMRIPAAPVGDGASLPLMAQFQERPFFRGSGPVMPGPPYRLSATPIVPGGQVPQLGQHTAELAQTPAAPRVASRRARPRTCPWPDCACSTSAPFGRGPTSASTWVPWVPT